MDPKVAAVKANVQGDSERGPATGSGPGAAPVRTRVAMVLERIRPAVQADGGDIELVDVTDAGIVRIRFLGACVGCPSSSLTLHMGIERNLKAHVPQVRGVEAVP